MINRIRNLIKKLYLLRLKKRGLVVGKNFQMEKGVNLDANFPWMIEIGNDVTLASWVYLVCHDGASKKCAGYSRIGRISIGNNVFVGAKSIILPNVSIGDNSIIGANSVVTKSIPPGKVAAGSPAVVIMDLKDYIHKVERDMKKLPIYGFEYTLSGGITQEKKEKMKNEVGNGGGFIL